MSDSVFVQEDEIIIKHTLMWFTNSAMNTRTFAVEVLAPALGERCCDGASEKAYSAWCSKQNTMVHRILHKERAFPLSIKWQWISLLPAEYREKCLAELAASMGYLHTLPAITGADSCLATLNEVMNSFSKMISHSQPAHDGVYDSRDDLAGANKMIDCLLTISAKCLDEARKVHAGTNATGTLHNINSFSLGDQE